MMWKTIAEMRGFNIPESEMERMSKVLDKLYHDVEKSFDRDLSTVEPIYSFQPRDNTRDGE